jgi:hypothetical protein
VTANPAIGIHLPVVPLELGPGCLKRSVTGRLRAKKVLNKELLKNFRLG